MKKILICLLIATFFLLTVACGKSDSVSSDKVSKSDKDKQIVGKVKDDNKLGDDKQKNQPKQDTEDKNSKDNNNKETKENTNKETKKTTPNNSGNKVIVISPTKDAGKKANGKENKGTEITDLGDTNRNTYNTIVTTINGNTVADIKKTFGHKCTISKEAYNGGKIIKYEDLPFSFAFDCSATDIENAKITGVYADKDSQIVDGAYVGMSFKELSKCFNQKIEIKDEYNHMEEKKERFVHLTLKDDVEVWIYFDKKDISTNAFIKFNQQM